MFAAYRAFHEIDAPRFLAVATSVARDELPADAAVVRAELRRRSRRFNLEVDCSPFLTPFAGMLADLYGDARFVLTIRDCFSWLDAEVESHFPPAPEHFETFRWASLARFEDAFAPEEAVLRDAGVAPVSSYLRWWVAWNESVLRAVPPDRLLVVRTEDLDGSAAALARFAGVPASTVHPAHANHRTRRLGLLAGVPASFVGEQARRHCGTLMERYWGPDWSDLVARLPDGHGR